MMLVSWANEDGHRQEQLAQASDVLALLDRLHAVWFQRGVPTIVFVEQADTSEMVIGLGADYSILSTTGPDGNPPYFVSVGDAEATGTFDFLAWNEPTEFRSRHLIDMNAARAGLVEFCETGKLASAITWEEV